MPDKKDDKKLDEKVMVIPKERKKPTRLQLLEKIGQTVIVFFEQETVECGLIGFLLKVMPDHITIKISSTKNETVKIEDIQIDTIIELKDYHQD